MAIRILRNPGERGLRNIFIAMNVDPYGIRIMAPKAETFLIKLSGLSCIAANILKQELLSCGGDAALPREVLTGRIKKTDCVLILNLSQFNRLKEKLGMQPFGLAGLSKDISAALENYRQEEFVLEMGRHKLRAGKKTLVMGIMNLTPDSFSGDGLYGKDLTEIAEAAAKMVEEGADILDLGGESSRPGARAVSVKEELKRVIPALKKLCRLVKAPVSVDTWKPEVARAALDNGASIINDITGLRNPSMVKVCAAYKSGVVIMHMKGTPRTMQKNPVYPCGVTEEVIAFLDKALDTALQAGISRSRVIVDPGIGFGKTLEDNLELLRNLKELKIIGQPILIGTSRKSFIGKILGVEPRERTAATVASCVLASANGADIVRVHDVKSVSQSLRLQNSILN